MAARNQDEFKMKGKLFLEEIELLRTINIHTFQMARQYSLKIILCTAIILVYHLYYAEINREPNILPDTRYQIPDISDANSNFDSNS